ncbi:unnamed protein product, partial [Rotaria magnacalcarata]
MAEKFLHYVKDKSNEIVSTAHEHISSMTDTTGTLAKQKLLQKLITSGVLKSELIRQALQMGA